MSKRPRAHLDELHCTAPPEVMVWQRSWVASLGEVKLSNYSALSAHGGKSSRAVPVGHRGSGSCHQRRVRLVLALLPRWQLTWWYQVVWQWHRSQYDSYSHVGTWCHSVVPMRGYHRHCWWLLWAINEQVLPHWRNECPVSCASEAFLFFYVCEISWVGPAHGLFTGFNWVVLGTELMEFLERVGEVSWFGLGDPR